MCHLTCVILHVPFYMCHLTFDFGNLHLTFDILSFKFWLFVYESFLNVTFFKFCLFTTVCCQSPEVFNISLISCHYHNHCNHHHHRSYGKRNGPVWPQSQVSPISSINTSRITNRHHHCHLCPLHHSVCHRFNHFDKRKCIFVTLS